VQRVSLPIFKRPERDITYASPSSAVVKEIVELYLYSTSVFSWRVLGPALNIQDFHKFGRVSELYKHNVAAIWCAETILHPEHFGVKIPA
jgi:hypothetical protein